MKEFSSGPRKTHLHYDLHSIVCHFGGSNSGHYTCYAKHPKENVWYYYNDETVCQQGPRDDHISSAYVLFYVRQGTDVSFQIPDKSTYQFVDQDLNNRRTTSDNATPSELLNSPYSKPHEQSMALVLYQPPPLPAQTFTATPSSPLPSSSSSALASSLSLSSSCREVVESSDCREPSFNEAAAESITTASHEQVEPDSTYDFYS